MREQGETHLKVASLVPMKHLVLSSVGLAAWVALAVAVLLAGCSDPGREAREVNAKYPIAEEVLELQKSMEGFAKDKSAREALEIRLAELARPRVAAALVRRGLARVRQELVPVGL